MTAYPLNLNEQRREERRALGSRVVDAMYYETNQTPGVMAHIITARLMGAKAWTR